MADVRGRREHSRLPWAGAMWADATQAGAGQSSPRRLQSSRFKANAAFLPSSGARPGSLPKVLDGEGPAPLHVWGH